MRRRLGLVCMVLLVAAAACGSDGPAPASRQSSEPFPSIESVVADLSGFVERERGLRFQEDVRVRVLEKALLVEELAKAGPDPAQAARLRTVLTILGLLDPAADPTALVRAAAASRPAFYDPARKELLVGEEQTPVVRSAIVRELTRALDDQHFGIKREIPGGEAAAAFQALVEGSAFWVEAEYVASLPEAQRRHVREQERIQPAQQLPAAVEQLATFPRQHGLAFVEALVEERTGRLDEAFSSPPVSSEQVLDPARYLSGDAPRQVNPPRTEGAVVDQGDAGQLLLRLLLASKLDPAVAAEASSGWGGGSYATWRSPDGRTCIRVQFAVDTPRDARQLEAALQEWVRRTTDREVDSAGLLLKACGPAPGQP